MTRDESLIVCACCGRLTRLSPSGVFVDHGAWPGWQCPGSGRTPDDAIEYTEARWRERQAGTTKDAP